MKKGLIFATTLAMALGVGVAVGAHQKPAVKSEAATKTTIYYAVTTSYTVKCNVRYGSYDLDPWETFEMTKTDDTFGGVPVYTCSFTDKYDGLGIMQLQQYDGGTWKSQVVAFDTWTTASTYNGKIYDGSWKTYTPDPVGQTHKVTPVVDGTAEAVIDVADGSTPVLKDNTYGKTFDGWYTASDYKTKVTEITSDCSVYGRFVDKETATYTIDDGYAKKFDSYNVYAWNEDGNNAEWPGLAVNGKAVTIPVDASFIINDGNAQKTVDISQEGAKAYLQLLSETDESGCFKVQWSDAAQEVPASEGYYIKGSASEWKYVADNKMSTEDLNEGDVAQFIGFEAKANDEIRVCSYYTDRSPFEQWASLQDGESEVGTLVGNNLKFTADGTYDIYAKYDGDQFLFDVLAHEEPEPADVPESDGYYLVGTETSWKYASAPKMSDDPVGKDDAVYFDYVSSANEKLKVRMYEAERAEGPDVYGRFVENEGSEGIATVDEEGNMVFAAADLHVDIFAKWEKTAEDPETWEILFYVTAHAERYTISIYDVLFEGKRLASTSEIPHVGRATAGVDFEYELPEMYDYRARKLYKDAACTVEYTPTKYTADGTLYAKYTRLGYYMTGDENYSGEGLAWNIDGATYLPYATNDPKNLLEGSVTIPDSASETPISVKPLEYKEDGTWGGVEYTLGTTYSFCYMDTENPDPEARSNLVFTKGGTFAIYVNTSLEVWINEGADAFYTKFLTDTGAVCKTDNTTDPVRLGEVWEELKGVYESLSPTEKETIEAIGFNGGDEKGDDLHKMMARYSYIVTKYGSDAFENFIFPLVHVDPHPNMVYGGLNAMAAADNTTMIIVISIAAVSAIAFTMLLVFKKRKQK